MGGGMGGMPQQRDVDTTGLYKALGVEKSASAAQIKKAYRKLAIKHHPDKGGDEQTFKKINEAFAILSDSEKREIYDEHGMEGVDQGGGRPAADDIFSMFFGGGGRGGSGRQQRGPRKGDDVVHPLKMSLENLYNGKTVKLRINRQRVKYPKGMDAESAVETCTDCRGRGAVIRVQQIGPGMMRQMQQQCPSCNGTGKMCDKKVKVVKEATVLEVHIEKGMRHGQKVVFSGEADESPGMLPGDIVFVIQQKDHETFKRKGADLVIEKTVTLQEALCGVKFPIKHLDGRTLVITNPPGEVLEPQALKSCHGEGMPVHKRPFEKGRLFILFKIEFPKKLSEAQMKVLASALPGPKDEPTMPMEEDEYDEVTFDSADPSDFGSTAAGVGHDSDDEGPGGGQQGVQCQQQ